MVGGMGEAPPKAGRVGARLISKLLEPSRTTREDGLLRSITSIWESICSASSLMLGLSSPSSSLPSANCSSVRAQMGGLLGSGVWIGSLNGEVTGRFRASTATIQP